MPICVLDAGLIGYVRQWPASFSSPYLLITQQSQIRMHIVIARWIKLFIYKFHSSRCEVIICSIGRPWEPRPGCFLCYGVRDGDKESIFRAAQSWLSVRFIVLRNLRFSSKFACSCISDHLTVSLDWRMAWACIGQYEYSSWRLHVWHHLTMVLKQQTCFNVVIEYREV
jgi:hypothetical protein